MLTVKNTFIDYNTTLSIDLSQHNYGILGLRHLLQSRWRVIKVKIFLYTFNHFARKEDLLVISMDVVLRGYLKYKAKGAWVRIFKIVILYEAFRPLRYLIKLSFPETSPFEILISPCFGLLEIT